MPSVAQVLARFGISALLAGLALPSRTVDRGTMVVRPVASERPDHVVARDEPRPLRGILRLESDGQTPFIRDSATEPSRALPTAGIGLSISP